MPGRRTARGAQKLQRDPRSHGQMMKNAIEAVEALYQRALPKIKAEVTVNGKLSGDRLNHCQLGAHALAYLATELNACKQLAAWATQIGDEWSHDVAAAYIGEAARSLRAGVELT